MRAVIQRVSQRSGSPSTEAVVGAVGAGLLVLLGVARGGRRATTPDRLAGKVARLRIFEIERRQVRPAPSSTSGARRWS